MIEEEEEEQEQDDSLAPVLKPVPSKVPWKVCANPNQCPTSWTRTIPSSYGIVARAPACVLESGRAILFSKTLSVHKFTLSATAQSHGNLAIPSTRSISIFGSTNTESTPQSSWP